MGVAVLEKMDTAGKRHQRLALANAIMEHFPKGSDGYIISLSGLHTDKKGKLIHGCELWWFLEFCHWNPARIITVDKDPDVVKRNNSNTDRRCKGIKNVCGDFKDVVRDYAEKENISVVNFDSCGDAKVHGWEVPCMMDVLNNYCEKGKILFFTNWNTKGRSTGGSYNAYEVLKQSGFISDKEYSFHQIQRGYCSFIEEYTDSTWKHFGAELNGKKDMDFEYIGGFNTPMQSVWFVRDEKYLTKTK